MMRERGEAPSPPPVDDEMVRELVGRDEVAPPVALELPTPGEPSSNERRRHGLTHVPCQAWCNVCVRARGRENRLESRSQVQPGTPVIQCDYCFLKTDEEAPIITVLVAIDTVYKHMVAIPTEKKGLALCVSIFLARTHVAVGSDSPIASWWLAAPRARRRTFDSFKNPTHRFWVLLTNGSCGQIRRSSLRS